MTIDEYSRLLGVNTLQYRYFRILQDEEWHCRKCSQPIVGSEQLAGGGGVQGLQRGNRTRPGIVIETVKQQCERCGQTTTWDRWTGEFKDANSAAGIPKRLQRRILEYYDYYDSIELRRRQDHELVIDHRFPMERWGTTENQNDPTMSDEEIESKFQLLKKDTAGNHNLLKSRACERCIASGIRGYPLGIKFFYSGGDMWPEDCPESGPEAEQGCIGCGWYDFNTWRQELNRCLNQIIQDA